MNLVTKMDLGAGNGEKSCQFAQATCPNNYVTISVS